MSEVSPEVRREIDARLQSMQDRIDNVDVSRRQLAKNAGIGASALSEVLSGKRDARFSTIVRIEVALKEQEA